MLRFSKGYWPHSFHPISTKLYRKNSNQVGIQTVTFFGDLPKKKIKILWHFVKFLLTQDHMGMEISERYSPCSFHPMSIELHEAIGYSGGIQAIILFFAIGQVLKILWHLEILTWEPMGKYSKMCNIFKAAGRSA